MTILPQVKRREAVAIVPECAILPDRDGWGRRRFSGRDFPSWQGFPPKTSSVPVASVFLRLPRSCCSCVWAVSVRAAEKNSSYQAALESIKADELAEEVGTLANDAMEGREAGTRGGRAAADYLAGQYARLHLRGGGPDGAFLQPFEPNFHNVLAILQGSDPKWRDQVIVVGAHYDHLGYGGRASLGPYGYIHPGADDNASGTAAVLELAKAFTILSVGPKRSILFAAWDAEEKGLLGSKHWVAHPTVPLGTRGGGHQSGHGWPAPR